MTETDWFTRTRWIVYGAASSLIESLQDQSKAQANWEKYGSKLTDVNAWDSLASELASKGAVTEEEARRYVEEMLNPKTSSPETPASNPGPVPIKIHEVVQEAEATDTTPISAADIAELMDLTREIENLRLDLEKRRLDGDV
ncbi:MAG: hypothetical protein Q6J68_06890 [Thermostichales cyanobacterium SZTDM-1c_bins_54]